MLTRWFQLHEYGTNLRTEILAGMTTFLTMAYIIVVQPAMLSGQMSDSPTGLDAGAVMVATCIAAAASTLLMGLWARYPIALAPGMGVNAYFVFTMIPEAENAGHNGWQVALGVVFVAGVLFLLLTALGVRERIMDAISPSLKNAIAVGIGLFIAFIGFKNAGLIQDHPVTFVHLQPDLTTPGLLVFFVGLLTATALHVVKVRGSILLGILASTAVAGIWHLTAASGLPGFTVADRIVSAPPSITPTLLQMDLAAVFTQAIFPFVLIFVFIDMFDTMGTLIGVAEQGGFMKDNKLPRAGRALGSDALGTVAGAALGTSTITSYIESVTGVEQGGRTGLVCVVVAIGFLLALFFAPVIHMIGSYPPITASALVLVGAMMMRNVVRIDWDDYTEAIPAFLIILGMPLTFSIGDGIALGLSVYPILKLISGRGKELTLVTCVLSLVLIVYFVRLRSGT